MSKRKIDWKKLQKNYFKNNIHSFNYQINDMDPIDMTAKAYTVASLISKLIKKGHKLYIHCTAGIGRAP